MDKSQQKKAFGVAIFLFFFWLLTRKTGQSATRSALYDTGFVEIQNETPVYISTSGPGNGTIPVPVKETVKTGTEATGFVSEKVKSFLITKTNDLGVLEIDFDGQTYTIENQNDYLSLTAETVNAKGYFTPKVIASNGANYKFITITL